jgi:hypothetical protein
LPVRSRGSAVNWMVSLIGLPFHPSGTRGIAAPDRSFRLNTRTMVRRR